MKIKHFPQQTTIYNVKFESIMVDSIIRTYVLLSFVYMGMLFGNFGNSRIFVKPLPILLMALTVRHFNEMTTWSTKCSFK